MFFLKKFGCRIYQTAFRLALPFLPYREPKIVHSCADLGGVLKGEGATSVLIVTDIGVIRNGLIKPVERELDRHRIPYAVYDKTQPNPTVRNVEDALAMYRNHHCDAIIAIGGGSPMDCAKGVGARAVYPRKSLNRMGGILRVLRKIPTLIAIPTTAGTGSETTLAAVITDSETHYKYAIMSFPLIPHYAVLDASLTYTLPPRMTSTTGVDALTHAVEVYIGRSTTRETRRLSLEATRLVFENVQTAYREPQNHEARKNMLLAAYQAGLAFSKSYVGYIHAIAHSLGGQYGISHGLSNAVIMPYVLEAYGPCIYKKLHRLGVAAGVCTGKETHEEGAKLFIEAIKALNASMDIPDQIPRILKKDIPEMARHAEKEANPLYPVPKLMTEKELEIFYYRVGGLK